MYNPYNPYVNQFYGQQMMNRQQPMEIPMQTQTTQQVIPNRQSVLFGKQVDSLEVVKAIDIPLDGSISYFPLTNGSAIVTKQLQQDGTSKLTIYKPEVTQQEAIKNDINTLEEIRDELKSVKKELKELKNKFKTKDKED